MVLVHIAVIFYASHRGYLRAEILSRTRGSIAWALFYGALRACRGHPRARSACERCSSEWTPLRGRACDLTARCRSGLLLAVLGLRAVAAVVLP